MTHQARSKFYGAVWQWGLLLLPLACLAGCHMGSSGGVVRDGTSYGVTRGNFRHVWYCYYERGRSYAEGRFWEKAEADFRQAITRRAHDTGLARTYGMHFMTYYPNRERGIALLQMGKIDDALAALEASHRTAPSARGAYWLDESRRQQLVRDGRDHDAPMVAGVMVPERTRDAHVSIMLKASDDTFVKHVRVDGHELSIPLASPEVALHETLALHDGMNTIKLEAEDLTGKRTTQTLSITLDRTGPVVGLADVVQKPDGMHLRGYVLDDSEEVTLHIGASVVSLTRDAENIYSFSHVVPDAKEMVAIVARDGLGNETRAPVGESMFAAGWPVGPLVATQGGAAIRPLDIVFRNFSDRQQVFQEMVIVDLEVRALEPVASLRMAGASLSVPKSRSVFLSQRVYLRPGMNDIAVEVTDVSGHSETRTLQLERMETGAWGLESRATIAVAPFRGTSDAMTEQAPLLRQALSAEILRDRRFREVARDPQEWQTLSAALSAVNPMTERTSGIRFGKLMKADYLLFVDLVPSLDGVEALCRLIDVQSGRVVATPQVYALKHDEIRARMTDLAYQLRQAVPLITGSITEVTAGKVEVNRGTRARMERGQFLLMCRPAPHEADAAMLGTAEVKTVTDESATAIPQKGHALIRPNDLFITR